MEYVPGEGEDETILDVLGELESQGFTGQFMPREGGQVECLTCHRLSPADETVFRQLRRLEGASDPDDMLAVVGPGRRRPGGGDGGFADRRRKAGACDGDSGGSMPRVFSGIQPTGDMHLGNYVGAVRRW
ncbi:MAG: hypothetical protein ACJ73V_11955, partial [Acidimicrobiia bacterium]